MEKTSVIKFKQVTSKWYLIDAKGVRLGRLATKTAGLIMGKHKVAKTDNFVSGDKVVIINAAHIEIYKKNRDKKMYRSHSGYMSGLTEKTFTDLLKKNPVRIIHQAVKGMLPQNRLGNAMLTNLYIYAGEEHPHIAQKPETIDLKKNR